MSDLFTGTPAPLQPIEAARKRLAAAQAAYDERAVDYAGGQYDALKLAKRDLARLEEAAFWKGWRSERETRA